MAQYKIIVTEKPSVAQEYRKVLQITPNGKKDGYIEGFSSVLNENFIITWCVGHLCTLSYPEVYGEQYKKWDLAVLPFLPSSYKYEVIPSVKKQFQIIKGLYNREDISAIYYAGDAGREGIYIQMLVRQMAGHKKGIEEKVVWIDSYTEREILRGIKDAKDVSFYKGKTEAAYMRGIEDYAVGINFSRALSCKYGKDFNNRIGADKWKPLSVGRVMTCVLGMVVEREREIRNFVETPFYKIESDTGFKGEWKAVEKSAYYNSPFLYNESGFKEREKAEFLLATLNNEKTLTVESVKKGEERKKAPLLFNLAEIQFECSKKYKLSPDETLAIIQSLYEKKLVTYPRTDARVLSSAVAGEVAINLNGLAKLGYKTDFMRQIAMNKWHKNIVNSPYVDDSKITDHYAIIPTGYITGADTLTELEEKIYHDIITRFLCIFYPPAVYTKVEAVLLHNMQERFFASKKTLKEAGYMAVLDDCPAIEDNPMSVITEGQVLPASYEIKEGKTTPPKRYTSGSMVIAMENAGKMIEDEALREQIKGSGIGTSATRAEIIKKLVSIEYLDLNKKTQILTPDVIGENAYDIIKSIVPALLKPEMTANWERGLDGIENGSVTYDTYLGKMEAYIRKEVEAIKGAGGITYEASAGEKKVMAEFKCPKCGKGIVRENQKAYGCSEYKNGCDFTIWKNICGKTVTAAMVEKLLSGKQTQVIKGLKKKDGNTFDAALKLKNNAVSFVFPNRKG